MARSAKGPPSGPKPKIPIGRPTVPGPAEKHEFLSGKQC